MSDPLYDRLVAAILADPRCRDIIAGAAADAGRWLDYRAVAEHLNLRGRDGTPNVRAARRWIKENQIPADTIGGTARRFDRHRIDRAIEAQRPRTGVFKIRPLQQRRA